MSVVRWPAELSAKSNLVLRAGFQDSPANNLQESDMEDGAKTRRKFSRGYSMIKGAWRFKRDEYQVFRVWVRDDLKDGGRAFAFDHPLREYVVSANFKPQDGEAYSTEFAAGGDVIVSFELRYLDRALA